MAVVPIRARWASQPMPVSSFVMGDRIIPVADMAKMVAGRRIDVYTHQDERLTLAIKHAGDSRLHLFTNESLQYERGCNPEWRLDQGTYRLRVTVYYERGDLHADFEVANTGTGLDDVTVKPWSGTNAA